MVPSDFANFFLASVGAGAALVGLLFVAIAVAPERTVMGSAPVERRAVASSAFTALVNAFFISLNALVPHTNIAWLTLSMSIIGIINSLYLGFTELRKPIDSRNNWQMAIRRIVLVMVSLILYIFELSNAIQLILAPGDTSSVVSLTTLVMCVYGVGIVRAWELLGASRFGLFRWFNPLYEINEKGYPMAGADKSEKTV